MPGDPPDARRPVEPPLARPSAAVERRVDHLHVHIHPDPDRLARAAADRAAAVLRGAVAARGVAHAMFATGNSQLAFVEVLVHDTPDVPWGDVVVFHMDEYVGVGPDHPAGFQHWIRQRIVEPTRPRQAWYLDGLAPPDEECARYAALLRAHPLDLCCLGIGENGHLAFNDPPVADFDDPLDVKVVELDPSCRAQQVHEGHFPTTDDVPAYAVTVTVPALLRAGRVLAIVPEGRKAEPVRAALEGPVGPACPATALRAADQAELHLEAASASLLAPG
jgi:glucosamine-6-phosphate deaminase